jgi:hypothetical protein
MNKKIVVFIVVLLFLIVIIGVSYYLHYKLEKYPVCNVKDCNDFIYDNIVRKDEHFQTNESTPCKACKPYFNYAWTPAHGLSYDKGNGWIPCETKDHCYDILKSPKQEKF